MVQSNLLKTIVELHNKFKAIMLECKKIICESQESTYNAFKSGIFVIKATKSEGLKILTPNQRLQRLPIALPQVKTR